MSARLSALVALLVLAAPGVSQQPRSVTGTWKGVTVHPRHGEVSFTLLLVQQSDGKVAGGLDSEVIRSPLAGQFDAEAGVLTLDAALGNARASVVTLRLQRQEQGKAPRLAGRAGTIELDAARTSQTTPTIPARWIEVSVAADRPVTVDERRVDAKAAATIDGRVQATMRDQNLAGLSLGLVVGGKLTDVRSYGWEDARAKTPATAKTMYRWASISKTMTAIACLQLAERGALDLDRDVRGHVPEFPEKKHVITSRQLLGHLGGVTHYGANVVRTVREYEVEHPFADRILALDMFKETPLVAEPGTKFSYTTHGYALLGAVVERAGKQRFADQVLERVAKPLGMKTLAADHAWVAIPHRTPGYVLTPRGRLYPSPDEDDVSWKLAGGGWISSVVDLGRFAAGVARGELLKAETWKKVATRQRTKDGGVSPYGLGFRVLDLGGHAALAHSGSQERTATQMLVVPGAGCAVVVMCNTQRVRISGLARELLRLVVERR